MLSAPPPPPSLLHSFDPWYHLLGVDLTPVFLRHVKYIIISLFFKISDYIFEYLIKCTINVLVSTLNNPYYKKKL